MNAQAEIQLSMVWMAVLEEALSDPVCLLSGAALLFAVSPLVAWVAGRFFCRRWSQYAPRAYVLCWCGYGVGLAGVGACYLAAGHLEHRLTQAKEGKYAHYRHHKLPAKNEESAELKLAAAMAGALSLEMLPPPEVEKLNLSEEELKRLWSCWHDTAKREEFYKTLARKRFEQDGAGERCLAHLAALRRYSMPAALLLLAGLALSCAAAAYRAIRLIPIDPTLTPYLTPQL